MLFRSPSLTSLLRTPCSHQLPCTTAPANRSGVCCDPADEHNMCRHVDIVCIAHTVVEVGLQYCTLPLKTELVHTPQSSYDHAPSPARCCRLYIPTFRTACCLDCKRVAAAKVAKIVQQQPESSAPSVIVERPRLLAISGHRRWRVGVCMSAPYSRWSVDDDMHVMGALRYRCH